MANNFGTSIKVRSEFEVLKTILNFKNRDSTKFFMAMDKLHS